MMLLFQSDGIFLQLCAYLFVIVLTCAVTCTQGFPRSPRSATPVVTMHSYTILRKVRTEPSRSGRIVYSAVLCTQRMVMGLNPTNACGHMICKYMDWKGSAAMVASVQSAGVTPEVNLRITTGEKACKQGFHPSFETQGRHHQKSKTGVCPLKKHLRPPKRIKKEQKNLVWGSNWCTSSHVAQWADQIGFTGR